MEGAQVGANLLSSSHTTMLLIINWYNNRAASAPYVD